MAGSRTFLLNTFVLFCLLMGALLSSCSTTGFLQRKYTPGAYVEHTDKPRATYLILMKGDKALPTDNAQTPQTEQEMPLKEKCTERMSLEEENHCASYNNRKNLGRIHTRILKNGFTPSLKSFAEAGLRQAPPSAKRIRPAKKDEPDGGDADKDAKKAFKLSILSIILTGVLALGAFMVLKLLDPIYTGIFLLFLFIGIGLVWWIAALWIITLVYTIKSILHAKKEGVPVPLKALIALLIASLPLILGVLMILYAESPR